MKLTYSNLTLHAFKKKYSSNLKSLETKQLQESISSKSSKLTVINWLSPKISKLWCPSIPYPRFSPNNNCQEKRPQHSSTSFCRKWLLGMMCSPHSNSQGSITSSQLSITRSENTNLLRLWALGSDTTKLCNRCSISKLLKALMKVLIQDSSLLLTLLLPYCLWTRVISCQLSLSSKHWSIPWASQFVTLLRKRYCWVL